MAVLSKIRNRSGLLIGIIALALFAFIIGDLFKSGSFGGNTNTVGSVNGKDFDYQTFMQKAENITKQQQNTSVTAAMNNVWEQEVRSTLLAERCEKLGLMFGKEQMIGVIKSDPQTAQNPQFLNAAGKFDENKFKEFVKTKLADPDKNAVQAWLDYEKQILTYSKEQIYNTLLKASVYTTKAEAKVKYERENNKADFDYVSVAYSTVADDQVKVSDDEILDYMKKSPKKYKSDDTRTLEYVFVDNKPSAEDEAAMKSKIDSYLKGGVVFNEVSGKNDTISGFANASNVGAFVNKNSQIKFDSTYTAKKDLPAQYQEQLFNLASGQVYGPYVDGGYYKLSRIAARKGGASAKASHILIAYKGAASAPPTVKITKEEALAKANNILAKVKANTAQFATLAMENTDDLGSKQNGGVYDNIAPNQMVKPFNDYVFNKPVGSIGVVETDFGYHIIKNDAKYDAVLLGTVALKIQPSEKTENNNSDKALKLESEATANGLEKAAKKLSLNVNPSVSVKAIDEAVGNLGIQRQIVQWSFNDDTDVNDIRKFDTPEGFVVVKLKSINNNGLLAIDQAKQMIEPLIKNEKKATIIRKKMSGSTLEAVSKSSGSSILSATALSLSQPMIPNLGYEPKVIGAAFRVGPNKVSDLIDGNMAVYMIKGKLVSKAPALADFKTQIEQMNQQAKNSASYSILQSIKERANIKDNRGKL